VRRLARLAAVASSLLLGGCAQTFDATTLGVPATMAEAAGENPEGQHFRTSAHTVHAFWGLVPLSQPNLQKALSRQLVGGREITNLRITSKSGLLDLLITGLTLGLIAPRTVIYEGVVIGR
jgi:hypothetical protein